MMKHVTLPFFMACLIVGCVLVCAILGVGLVWRTRASEKFYRAALPSAAHTVQEISVTSFPAWEYYLKADMSLTQFESYLQALAMPLCSAEDHQWIGWHSFSAPEWWDPKNDISQSYCQKRNGDIWEMAKYEEGHLYLRAYSW